MKILSRLVAVCLLACALSPALVRAGGGTGEDPYEIGEKLFARKNYRTALKYYQKALKQDNARAHYRVGLIFEEAGKHDDALSHYRLFVARSQPDDPQHGDAVQRVKALEERVKQKAGRTAELLERGKRLFKSGKLREAEQALLQAAAGDPTRAEIHFYLGEVYLAQEKYEKAKAEYNKAKGAY